MNWRIMRLVRYQVPREMLRWSSNCSMRMELMSALIECPALFTRTSTRPALSFHLDYHRVHLGGVGEVRFQ